MKIAIGNDHSAVALKKELQAYLISLGYQVVNYGTDSLDSYDYPIAGENVAQAIVNREAGFGIVICGTGIGISIACNKVRGIRCANCGEPYSATMARKHNNANILALGARVVGSELAKMIVKSFLETEFESGRHQRRIDMISDIEMRESQK